MKYKSQDDGISMITLVATIIVLLILAGVSLNIIQGNNGILSRAGNSVDRYEEARAKEAEEMEDTEYMLDESNSEKATINKLKGKAMLKLSAVTEDDHLTTSIVAEKNPTNNTIDLTNYKILMRTSEDEENEWTETTSMTFDEPGVTVYACLYDGTTYGALVQKTVTEYDVDRVPPELTLAQLKSLMFGVTTSFRASDEGGSGLNYDKCGYVFTTSNADLGTDVSKYYKRINESDVTTTINDGLAAGTYYLHVLLTDKKGNTTTKTSTDTITVAATEQIAGNGTSASQKSGVLAPGIYKLECWGAQGGYENYYNGTQNNYGGYAYGTLNLSEKTNVYLKAGGYPGVNSTYYTTSNPSTWNAGQPGGWNGGAAGGYTYQGSTPSSHRGRSGGGGGASDIRLTEDDLYARVIVAGGGGRKRINILGDWW